MANHNAQSAAFSSKMPSKTTDDVLNGLHQVVQHAGQSQSVLYGSLEPAASAGDMQCAEGICQVSWKPPIKSQK